MFNRTKMQVMVLFSILLTSIAFQNFKKSSMESKVVKPIAPELRETHARELLGKDYEGSIVQSAHTLPHLHWKLYHEVYERLPAKFRFQSLAITQTILDVSEKHNFDPFFILALIRTESRFNPLAKGRHGEIGLMQIKPDTAKWIAQKLNFPWNGKNTLYNPIENIKIGSMYIDYLQHRFDGYAPKYLSAYNLGVTKVRRMYAQEKKPKEYSIRVMKYYRDTYSDILNSFSEHSTN